jgi:outer membrane protein TolC
VNWNNLFATLLAVACAHAQTDSVLTLERAREMALERNPLLKISGLREEEEAAKVSRSQSLYLPNVTLQAGAIHFRETPSLTVPAGALGISPVLMPASDMKVGIDRDIQQLDIMAYQPLTQLLKVSTGVQASRLDHRVAQVRSAQGKRQILYYVEQAWMGARIARWQRKEIELRVEQARERLTDAQTASEAGKILSNGATGLAASLADEETNLLESQDKIETIEAQLRNLTGIPSSTPLYIDTAIALAQAPQAPPLDSCLKKALDKSSTLQESRLTVEKAQAGIRAGRQSLIPDVGAFAGCSWDRFGGETSKPNPYVGVLAQWNLLDLRTNSQELGERHLQMRQADLKLQHDQDSIRTEVERAWRKLGNASARLEAARRALEFRNQDLREQTDRFQVGLTTRADWLGFQVSQAKSQGDAEAALAATRLASLELSLLMGND